MTPTTLAPKNNHAHGRTAPPPGEQIVEEMRAHALAYFTEQGHDSVIGHWLWNLARDLEPELCPAPDNVIAFPMQRRPSS